MPAQLSIQLVVHGRSPRESGHLVPRRSLPFVLLEWADAGAWQLRLDAHGPLRAPAPQVLVVAQEDPHALLTVGEPCTSTYLLLKVEVDGVPALSDPALSGVLPLARSLRIHACAERAVRPSRTVLEAVQAQRALHELVEVLLDRADGVPALPRPHGRMAGVLSRMEARLGDALARADLARWAELSPTRFHTVFQEELGMPPMAYLRMRRLHRAQELLATTALPIHQIASQCGFPSVYHFSRLFHRHQGWTPTAYRSARWQR